MRTFTKMRQFTLNYEEVIKRVEINENETKENKQLILKAFNYLEQILTDTKKTDEKIIGFKVKNQSINKSKFFYDTIIKR